MALKRGVDVRLAGALKIAVLRLGSLSRACPTRIRRDKDTMTAQLVAHAEQWIFREHATLRIVLHRINTCSEKGYNICPLSLPAVVDLRRRYFAQPPSLIVRMK
jgi:hypothetical protein